MHDQRRAAVIVLIKNINGQDCVLLTKRAASLRSHSGEVALPGGKYDDTDINLRATALREAYEEVNANPCDVDIFKALAPNYSRANIYVKPFVARLNQDEHIKANPDEVADIFWVPIAFFLEDQRLRTDTACIKGRDFWAPAYAFGNYVIWGLTARIIVDMLNACYQANIVQHQKLWA